MSHVNFPSHIYKLSYFGKAQKTHGARSELKSVFGMEKVDR
jgi:hypothetical protein